MNDRRQSIAHRAFPVFCVCVALALSAGCGNGSFVRQAGGDDMGNFLQARVVDGNGRPVSGRIQILSDRDTLDAIADESGSVRVGESARDWIRFVTPAGQYLFDGPPESGDLGVLAVGALGTMEGWIATTGDIAIPGVGELTRNSGGVFVFDSVPPGNVRVVVGGSSVLVRSPGGDAVLPPLVREAATLRAVSVQGVSCDSACKVYYLGKPSIIKDSALSWPTTCRPWSDASGLAWNDTVRYGTLCDARDGQSYRTVVVGRRTWMAQNLAYAGAADSVLGRCVGDDPLQCALYGRFYDWKTAAGLPQSYKITNAPAFPDSIRRGICPMGWRLPTISDWDTLVGAANLQNDSDWNAGLPWVDSGDGYRNVFWYLKSIQGWTSDAITRDGDDFGFRALPAGFLDASGKRQKDGAMAVFTSMTQSGKGTRVSIIAPGVTHPNDDGMDIGYLLPVRCLEE